MEYLECDKMTLKESIPNCEMLEIKLSGEILEISLNRIDVFNALNPKLIQELIDVFSWAASNSAATANSLTTENGEKLPRLGVLDCGIKYNILRELSKRFEVLWSPPDIEFDELVEKWKISALFCSNGPGDPAQEGKATSARKTLAAGIKSGMPTMGICLGHQLLGLGAGLETYKMLYGHRGANQPVINIKTGKVSITSQNHGFAVADPQRGKLAEHPSGISSGKDENLIGSKVKVSHINANDSTVEGLEVIGKPAFSVQYHPEACPGPHDASELFDYFESLIRGGK